MSNHVESKHFVVPEDPVKVKHGARPESSLDVLNSLLRLDIINNNNNEEKKNDENIENNDVREPSLIHITDSYTKDFVWVDTGASSSKTLDCTNYDGDGNLHFPVDDVDLPSIDSSIILKNIKEVNDIDEHQKEISHSDKRIMQQYDPGDKAYPSTFRSVPDRSIPTKKFTDDLHNYSWLTVECQNLNFKIGEIEPIFISMSLWFIPGVDEYAHLNPDLDHAVRLTETWHFDMTSPLIYDHGRLAWAPQLEDQTEVTRELIHMGNLPPIARNGLFSFPYLLRSKEKYSTLGNLVGTESSNVYLIIQLSHILQGDVDYYSKGKKAPKSEKIMENMNRLYQWKSPLAWAAVPLYDPTTGNLEDIGEGESSAFRTLNLYQMKHGVGMTDNGLLTYICETLSNPSKAESYRLEGSITLNITDHGKTSKGNIPSSVTGKIKRKNLLIGSDKVNYIKSTQAKILSNLEKDDEDENNENDNNDNKRDEHVNKDDIDENTEDLIQEISPLPLLNPTNPDNDLEISNELTPFTLYTSYSNVLYLYPISLDRFTHRNLSLKISLCKTKEKMHISPFNNNGFNIDLNNIEILRNVFNRKKGPDMVQSAWTEVTYHSKSPFLNEEIKIALPEIITPEHFIMFQVYHIHVKKKTDLRKRLGSISRTKKIKSNESTPCGVGFLPLLSNGHNFIPNDVYQIQFLYDEETLKYLGGGIYNKDNDSRSNSPIPQRIGKHSRNTTPIPIRTSDDNNNITSPSSDILINEPNLCIRTLSLSSIHPQCPHIHDLISLHYIPIGYLPSSNIPINEYLRKLGAYINDNKEISLLESSNLKSYTNTQDIINLLQNIRNFSDSKIAMQFLLPVMKQIIHLLTIGIGDKNLDWINPISHPRLRSEAFLTLLHIFSIITKSSPEKIDVHSPAPILEHYITYLYDEEIPILDIINNVDNNIILNENKNENEMELLLIEAVDEITNEAMDEQIDILYDEIIENLIDNLINDKTFRQNMRKSSLGVIIDKARAGFKWFGFKSTNNLSWFDNENDYDDIDEFKDNSNSNNNSNNNIKSNNNNSTKNMKLISKEEKNKKKNSLRLRPRWDRLENFKERKKRNRSHWWPYLYEIIISQWYSLLCVFQQKQNETISLLEMGEVDENDEFNIEICEPETYSFTIENMPNDSRLQAQTYSSILYSLIIKSLILRLKYEKRKAPIILDDITLSSLEMLIGSLAEEAFDRNCGLWASQQFNLSTAKFLRQLFTILVPLQNYRLVSAFFSAVKRRPKTEEIEMKLSFLDCISEYDNFIALNCPSQLLNKFSSQQLKAFKMQTYRLKRKQSNDRREISGTILRGITNPESNWLSEIIIDECMSQVSLKITPKLRKKSLEIIRKLFVRHSYDIRYQDGTSKRRIAQMYLSMIPLIVQKTDEIAMLSPQSPERKDICICLLYILQDAPESYLKLIWSEMCKSFQTKFVTDKIKKKKSNRLLFNNNNNNNNNNNSEYDIFFTNSNLLIIKMIHLLEVCLETFEYSSQVLDPNEEGGGKPHNTLVPGINNTNDNNMDKNATIGKKGADALSALDNLMKNRGGRKTRLRSVSSSQDKKGIKKSGAKKERLWAKKKRKDEGTLRKTFKKTNTNEVNPMILMKATKWLAHQSVSIIVKTLVNIINECATILSLKISNNISSNSTLKILSKGEHEYKYFLATSLSLILRSIQSRHNDIGLIRLLYAATGIIRRFGAELFIKLVGNSLQDWLRQCLIFCNSHLPSLRHASRKFLIYLISSVFQCTGSISTIRIPLLAIFEDVLGFLTWGYGIEDDDDDENLLIDDDNNEKKDDNNERKPYKDTSWQTAAAARASEQLHNTRARRPIPASIGMPINSVNDVVKILSPLMEVLHTIYTDIKKWKYKTSLRRRILKLYKSLSIILKGYIGKITIVHPHTEPTIILPLCDINEDDLYKETNDDDDDDDIIIKEEEKDENNNRNISTILPLNPISLESLFYEAANIFSPSELPRQWLGWIQSLRKHHIKRNQFAEAATCYYLIASKLQSVRNLVTRVWAPSPTKTTFWSLFSIIDPEKELSQFLDNSNDNFEEVSDLLIDDDDIIDNDNKNKKNKKNLRNPDYLLLSERIPLNCSPWRTTMELDFDILKYSKLSGELYMKSRLTLLAERSYLLAIDTAKMHHLSDDVGLLYKKVSKIYQELDHTELRFAFGSYFRVQFLGLCPETLRGNEYIYRCPGSKHVSTFQNEIKDFVEAALIKNNNNNNDDNDNKIQVLVLPDSADLSKIENLETKAYVKITNLKYDLDTIIPTAIYSNKIITNENDIFNLDSFYFNIPFTLSGKAIGDISSQWKRKSFLNVKLSFPSVLSRQLVESKKIIELSPIEVAIEDIKSRNAALENEKFTPTDKTDVRSLMQLTQGSVIAAVNGGVTELSSAFLSTNDMGEYDALPNISENDALDARIRLKSAISAFILLTNSCVNKVKWMLFLDDVDLDNVPVGHDGNYLNPGITENNIKWQKEIDTQFQILIKKLSEYIYANNITSTNRLTIAASPGARGTLNHLPSKLFDINNTTPKSTQQQPKIAGKSVKSRFKN